ncbi:MAG TPA: hypothetical protein VK196_01875 [Magnetospirillum sp.]|nr:hypothetical protein [Magnetospirillum sp.]
MDDRHSLQITTAYQLAIALMADDPEARHAARTVFLDRMNERYHDFGGYLKLLAAELRIRGLARDLNSAFLAIQSDVPEEADGGLRALARYAHAHGRGWAEMFLDDLFVSGPRWVMPPRRTTIRQR